MTLEEKRDLLEKHCDTNGCEGCLFNDDKNSWCNEYNTLTVPEDECDKALAIINKTSNVDHPSHYNQGGIECIDSMISAFGKEKVADFCIINAFKYIWRYNHKNGQEDINKAYWYMNKYRELTSNE